MSPKHAPRRARVVFDKPVEQRIARMAPDERVRLDRAIVAISIDPGQGKPLPANALLRDYRVDDTRVIYFASALSTIVVVAYVEA